MSKLTKRTVEAAEVKVSEYFVWDGQLPGFGLRVLPSGRKGYVVQFRAGRRSRRISLGPSTVVTCEQARNRAITIIAAGFVTLAGFICFYCLPGECPAKRFQCLSLASPRSKTASTCSV